MFISHVCHSSVEGGVARLIWCCCCCCLIRLASPSLAMSSSHPLHIHSPLRESLDLSKVAGIPVYLKMDSSQPSGSFKIRGIGHLCKAVRDLLWDSVPPELSWGVGSLKGVGGPRPDWFEVIEKYWAYSYLQFCKAYVLLYSVLLHPKLPGQDGSVVSIVA